MDLPFHKIANIAISTAHRIYKIFEMEDNVEAVQQKCRPELRALDEHGELIVIGLMLENPTLYLDMK